MKLPKPFYQVPIRFDVARLQTEVAAFPDSAWARHPNGIEGNSSLRLISAGGGENDDVVGPMDPTPHLLAAPYLRQVLTSFGVVWSRSRLLKLAPEHGVPEHSDINYHWFYRVRLHIPVFTHPQVRFHCDGQSVHMAAGECWVFDNWRLHHVENPVEAPRIHLVADTTGSAAFWRMIGEGQAGARPVQELHFDPAHEAMPLTERQALRPVMPPGEVDYLVLDLRSELMAGDESPQGLQRLASYHALVDGFRRDWRQLYSLFGEDQAGWPEYRKLRDSVRAASRTAGEGILMRSNHIAAHSVFEARVLRPVMSVPEEAQSAGRRSRPAVLDRPVFIVAAPRSGSTLLFETLAASSQLCSMGGEAHWLVEAHESLQPGAPGVESNRLTAAQATETIRSAVIDDILSALVDSEGRPVAAYRGLRFLEKTPKNALRIPFFDHIFPDARFIFLWRDPEENLGSIIDAWQSGRWKTYNGLPGFDGPWSLLLPPGWQSMNGRPLQQIAAFQWDSTNRIVLDDLSRLPRERWTAIRYGDLVSDPATGIRRLCKFIGIDADAALLQRLAAPLPASKYTLTAPAPDKWRRHQQAIEQVLPALLETRDRLRSTLDR